jgi:hypothetical protein
MPRIKHRVEDAFDWLCQRPSVGAATEGRSVADLSKREGRTAQPSACVIDAQSVKTSTSVPAAGQGTNAAKKIVGRKQSIITDTLGLLLAVLVTAASVQDSDAGRNLGEHASHP